MEALAAPGPVLNAFEQARLDRIAENRRRMEECGILDTANELAKLIKPVSSKPIAPRKPKMKRQKTRRQPARRSPRLLGEEAEFAELKDNGEGVTYSDYEPRLRDLLADGADIDSMPQQKQEQFQEMRCSSTGRGSMYDSVVGITCHFCRQKKLCGEDNCPRCSKRSLSAECIGKTECSRCLSATGKFCRACLQIRYGQTMEDAQAEMAAGTWLCPHCYEEEHPQEGWMCNSSICMKRRGFKPTGIAIYDAQQRGFPSVAHWLQAQLLKQGGSQASSSSGGACSGSTADAADAFAAAAADAGDQDATAGGAPDTTKKTHTKRADAGAAAAAAAGKTRSGKALAAPKEAPPKATAGAGGAKKAPPAAAAATAGRGKKGAADSEGASAAIISRQGSSGGGEGAAHKRKQRGAAGGGEAAGDADEAADVAPPTPTKGSEPITPGGGAAGAGRRVTRAALAAAVGVKHVVKRLVAAAGSGAAHLAGGAGSGAAHQAGGSCKRACVGESADARRSLRMRA